MKLQVDGFGEVMDDGDSAALHAGQEVEIALRQQREKAQAGPQLIDADTGEVICWECEQPIPEERLERLPMAAFCVPCLEIIEHRRKLRREDAP